MATKKQKREALEEKRRLDLAETQAAGLAALERDRQRRARAQQKKIKDEQDRLDKLAKEKQELARLEQERIYQQYLQEEEACRQLRASQAMRAMASSRG